MTKKQKRFVEEYLIDLNATQAAIRAGYSSNSASEIGFELLKKPDVRAHVDKAIAERSKRTGINQDRVIRELARIGFANIRDVADSDAMVKMDASDDDLAAVQSIKVKQSSFDNGDATEREVKIYDKNKALELLGRHLGMFDDRMNVGIDGSINIHVDYGEDDEPDSQGK